MTRFLSFLRKLRGHSPSTLQRVSSSLKPSSSPWKFWPLSLYVETECRIDVIETFRQASSSAEYEFEAALIEVSRKGK
jgi:hypothetical protein